MMNNGKSPYMLIFRGNDWGKDLSADELQRITNEWMGWFDRLNTQGKVTAGNPLENRGKVVTGTMVADGPFAESKEAVGGYFLLQVENMDEAVEIAKQCPGLPYGAIVEVRPVADECPLAACARESAAQGSLAHTRA